MIVRPPELAHRINDKVKVTHRRPVDGRDYRIGVRKGKTHAVKPFRPQLGQVRSIRTSSDRALTSPRRHICHIEITDATTEVLGYLTADQAHAEGHPSVPAFISWWLSTHDFQWLDRQRTDLAEHFASDPDDAQGFLDALAAQRYQDRHADSLVWLLHFRVVQDVPMLLSRHGDYTTSSTLALPEEPEAIDTARLKPHWAEHARGRHNRIRSEALAKAREDRDQLELHQRIMVAELAAQDNCLDLRSEFRGLRHMISTGRPDDAIKRVLVDIERAAYREAA